MHTTSRHRSRITCGTASATEPAHEPVTIWHPTVTDAEVSPRVRLEVEILSSEPIAPTPVLARADTRLRQTVLLVSRQAEVRRHLRACLQDQPKLRLVEVNSVSAAVSLAGEVAVHLIIADPGTANVVRALPAVHTVLVADESAKTVDAPVGARQHVMQRPFSAETLAATVLLLLREARPS